MPSEATMAAPRRTEMVGSAPSSTSRAELDDLDEFEERDDDEDRLRSKGDVSVDVRS